LEKIVRIGSIPTFKIKFEIVAAFMTETRYIAPIKKKVGDIVSRIL
jgi:hypothetical protein